MTAPAPPRGWRRHRFVLGFAGLSLVVLGPLLRPGFLLVVDSPIALNQDPGALLAGLTSVSTSVFGATLASAPYALFLDGLGPILGAEAAHKVHLFLLFFLAAWGASRLPGLDGVGRWYAGVLYAVNPFVYVRFLSGQWGVVLGHALLPFALTAWVQLLREPTARRAGRVALLSTAVGLSQIHALALLLLLMAGTLVAERFGGRLAWRALVLSTVLFAALNAYWILPAVQDATRDGAVTARFAAADFEAYKPRPTSPLGVVYDVASMHGFWRGRRSQYRFVHDLLPFSWILFAIVAGLALRGAGSSWRTPGRRWERGLVVLSAICFVLALGAATGPTRLVARWLWDFVPGYSAFRDSHKLVGVLALAYAFFGGLGLQAIHGAGATAWRRRVAYAALLVPVVFALPLFGLGGQARPTRFPDEWHAVRDVLRQDPGDYDVLFLPWHMYMSYHWLPNRDNVLSPVAPVFFGPQVAAADNIEQGAASQSLDPRSRYVEALLREFQSRSVQSFGELLAPLNVRYVILVEEVDVDRYGFLFRQADLEVRLRLQNIALFRNRHPHGRAYAVDEIVRVADVPALVAAAQESDVLGRAFVLDPRAPAPPASAASADVVPSERVGVAGYRLSEGARRYTVLAPRHGTTAGRWRRNGRAPVDLALGTAPIFENAGGGDIDFPRARTLRGLEGLALLVAVGLGVAEGRRKAQGRAAG